MSTFHERKQKRRLYLEENVFDWKQRPCTACSGSGIYDNTGLPACSACEGTGIELYKNKPISIKI